MTNNLTEARTAIKNLGFAADAVIDQCVTIFDRSSMQIKDFTSEVEAFLMNKKEDKLTANSLSRFENEILTKVKNTVQGNTPDTVLGKRQASAYVTPKSMPKFTQAPASASSQPDTNVKSLEASFSQVAGTAYSQRTTQGQNVLNYNGPLGVRGEFEPADTKPLGLRCKVTTSAEDLNNIEQRYRYMFTTLDERARNLDRHLLHLQGEMCRMAKIDENTLSPVGVPSQDTVWVCGRIVSEAPEGRINRTAVMLEGSRKESAGRKVRLDLSEIQSSFSLFPGQIVLVEGVNSRGRIMVAKSIIEGVARPVLTSSPQKLLEFHHSTHYQGGKPLTIVTAAGPFTPADNLNYQPLQDLLVHALKTKPDVLILVGPFVDVTQPHLSSGTILLQNEEDEEQVHEASYEMVFVEKVVRDCLSQMFNSEEDFGGALPTHIILVPSLQDGHHEMVFPQPPFGDRDRVQTDFFTEPLGVLNIPFSQIDDPRKRVHLMPNPCMFRVNEVLIGVSSNDVLFSLSSDEVSQNIEGNRLVRLGAHLLQQQSFSPQFPIQTNTLSQFDLRQSRHWEFKANPDILVLPSRLQPLAKDVHGTLLVNPGQLTKGIGGGSYAEMHVHPVKKSELTDAVNNGKDAIEHNVAARTSVAVVKI